MFIPELATVVNQTLGFMIIYNIKQYNTMQSQFHLHLNKWMNNNLI